MARFLPMRVLAALLTLLLVALTGCEPSDCSGCADGEDVVNNDDCAADCPDSEASAWLDATVLLNRDGDPEDESAWLETWCQVAVFSTEDLTDGDTCVEPITVGFAGEGEGLMEIPPNKNLFAVAGNPKAEFRHSDCLPFHTEDDKTIWWSELIPVNGAPDEEVPLDLKVNRDFKGEYECEYDLYFWDDGEWGYFDTYDLGRQTMEMVNGKLETSGEYPVGKGYLSTLANKFNYVTSEPGLSLPESFIEDDGDFTLTWIIEEWSKRDVTCTLIE